jgi:broad specificity phosphatase PhoE
MKHLFVVRHGKYDFDTKDLIDIGKNQMVFLAQQIKPIIANSKTYLISSTVKRAIQSAQVLTENLGLLSEFDKFPWLYDGSL